jgi:hypothetical protein
MTLESIRKHAKTNRLEVEHILQAAAQRIPGLDDELERLITLCGWTDGGELPGGAREIPFRRWAVTAITFLRGGYDGLHQLAMEPEGLYFALALLEELHDPQAVDTAITICPRAFASPELHLSEALLLASTFNSLLSFKPPLTIPPSQEERIRGFLHRLLPACTSDQDRALAILALRGVGDASSLTLISRQPAFYFPYEGVLSATSKAIRKRLRTTAV